jgi:hypothetical protein
MTNWTGLIFENTSYWGQTPQVSRSYSEVDEFSPLLSLPQASFPKAGILGYGAFHMKSTRVVLLLMGITALAALTPVTKAQSAAGAATPSGSTLSPLLSPSHPQLDLIYRRPTERIKLRNYFFDTFGPYPIAAAAILGGINQAYKTPPEWGQGMGAYGERVGSDFGIAMVTTTTRYALAEAFREDTLYYRCECKGVLPRLGHAMISTVTARRGDDGHRVLSFSALVAPYAGSMTAVYGWYPNRYGVKDGLRMGNYTLLAYAGVNIVREFIHGGPHMLMGLDHSASTGAEAATSPRF